MEEYFVLQPPKHSGILFRRIGWDAKSGEGHLDALLRGTLLSALAELGHEATINEAVRRFNIFVEDRETPLLPPDVRKVSIVIYCTLCWGYLLILYLINRNSVIC